VALAVDSQRGWTSSSLKCSLAPVLWWAYLVASARDSSGAGENLMSGRQFLLQAVSYSSS
jgi:hypothetical protein